MRSQKPSSQPLPTHPAPCFILASRLQYLACHLQVPEMERPLPGIQVGNQFFSFFKALPDCRKTLGLTLKLSYRSDRTVVLKTAKGYSIWVEEPQGHLTQRGKRMFAQKTLSSPPPCRILVSQNQYQSVTITVPDLDKSVSAVQVGDRYFSIFRVTAEVEKVFDLIAKLAERGEETVLIGTAEGYGVCVWEKDVTGIIL